MLRKASIDQNGIACTETCRDGLAFPMPKPSVEAGLDRPRYCINTINYPASRRMSCSALETHKTLQPTMQLSIAAIALATFFTQAVAAPASSAAPQVSHDPKFRPNSCNLIHHPPAACVSVHLWIPHRSPPPCLEPHIHLPLLRHEHHPSLNRGARRRRS